MSEQGMDPAAGGQIPPELAAALQQQGGPMAMGGAPEQGPPQAPTIAGKPVADPLSVTNSLMRAIEACADRACAATDDRDVKDNATAAREFAQAVVLLDPTRFEGGETAATRRDATVPAPNLPPMSDGDGDGKIGS